MKQPIGILGLQGAVEPHRSKLRALGAESATVRSAGEIAACRGLIIPGGESTTLLKLIRDFSLEPALLDFAARRPCWGVCAGAILMAERVTNPVQESLGLMPVTVRRNGYGRQNESFIAQVQLMLPGSPSRQQEAVFIRAPQLVEVAPQVRVLARHGELPVALNHGMHLLTTYHPELSGPDDLHRYFMELCSRESDPATA